VTTPRPDSPPGIAKVFRPARQRSSPGPEFEVHVDPETGRAAVAGRLDGATAPLLHAALSTMFRAVRTRWTIDVSRLVVADDAGLRALVGAYRRAVQHARQLTLHGASRTLRGALTRLRLDRHLLPRDDDPGA
jgi:anti-anti-sigma factor